MKKLLGDIIILHMRIINENLMMYDSWDMEYDRQNSFSFWNIFCTFTPPAPHPHPPSPPLTAQRIKILKKWKKTLEISSFYTSVP